MAYQPHTLRQHLATLPSPATWHGLLTLGANPAALRGGTPQARRRVLRFQAFNPTGGTLSLYADLYTAGAWYQVGGPYSVGAGGIYAASVGIVAEPGEIFRLRGAALNVAWWLLEFDAASGLRSPRLASFAAGENTVYTCPAGKVASLVDDFMAFYAPRPLFFLSNNSGATRTFHWSAVAAGGTPGATNRFMADATLGNGAAGSVPGPLSLEAGDFLSLSLDAGTPALLAWVNVVEQ